ncbi:hypothetical protein C8Q75DRAFT_533927 [Abortiporus biennis]|nr:hypothetical protein C8Q75DRAFT_533927 [Abortiporus biennis]
MENGIGTPLKPSITPLFDFISHIQGLPSRTVIRQLLSECLDSTWPTKQFDQDDPQSYDEGLVALDNIIMVLHHLQQRLSIRRNAMASFIRKLPDDLLLEVFLHLGLNVKDKIAVAQTCARWRKLSLQSPCLWTSLDLSSLPARILGTTLERSDGLPLTITCSTSNMHLDQVLPSALHRIRILDLRLQNPSKDYQESCPDWLGLNSPSTTVDDLRITSHYREVHLPHDLLQHYPRLTKLSLTNCRMSFSPGVYTNLKKLHIQQFGRVHTYHADVDLLHVFVDSPDLEDVALVGCSAVGSHPWDNQFGTLPLLHLRRMYLKLTPLCLRRIMSSVVASPNLESIRIISTPAPNGRHDPLTFVSANSLLSPFLRDAKSLSIDTRHGQLGMIGYMDPDMEKQTFEIRDSDMLAEASSFLSSLLKFYPMPSVRRIRIKAVGPRFRKYGFKLHT